jgi:hypothetical protein
MSRAPLVVITSLLVALSSFVSCGNGEESATEANLTCTTEGSTCSCEWKHSLSDEELAPQCGEPDEAVCCTFADHRCGSHGEDPRGYCTCAPKTGAQCDPPEFGILVATCPPGHMPECFGAGGAG